MNLARRLANVEKRLALLEAEQSNWQRLPQAASRLGLSPSTIRRHIKQHSQKYPQGRCWRRVGKFIEINVSTYMEILANGTD